jgi:hypothetical protein
MSDDYSAWLKTLGVDVNQYSWDPEDALTGGLESPPRLEPKNKNKGKKKGGAKEVAFGEISGDEGKEIAFGEVAGDVGSAWSEKPRMDATMGGRGAGLAYEQTPSRGKVSESYLTAEGSAEAGYRRDARTGAEFAGAKASGKAAVAEINAELPGGKVSASFLKAEGSAMAGYEYDPESKVTFAGVKASGSASVLDGKIETDIGNIQGQLLSASASSKTGVEVDEKTGKIFIGTSNSAEAKVAEVQGKLQTPDGSAQVTSDVQLLKAEASADANVVVDKYGADFNYKLGAEASVVKGEVGAEYRLTPKALYDNTLGWMTNTTAPDVLDIGPVIGGKVSGALGTAGGTVEGGGRLGVDEINYRGGVDLGLGEGVGLNVKAGMRLGPLKVAYDHKDEIIKAVGDAGEAVSQEAGEIVDGVSDVASKAFQYGREVGIGLDPTGLGTTPSTIADAASKAYEYGREVGIGLDPAAVGTVGKAIGGAASAAAAAASNVGSAMVGGAGQVASAAAGAAESVGEAVGQGVGGVASAAASAVAGVGSAVSDGVSGVASAAASAVEGVGSAVGGAASGLADAASSTWDNLWN